MTPQEGRQVAARAAVALLLNDGSLTFAEIQALPFVETEEDALAIVGHLLRTLDAEQVDRRGPHGVWESVIQLRSPEAAIAATAQRDS